MECSSAQEGARCVQGQRRLSALQTVEVGGPGQGCKLTYKPAAFGQDTRQGQQHDPRVSGVDPTRSKYLATFQVNTKCQLNVEGFTDANGRPWFDYVEERGRKQLAGADTCLENFARLQKRTHTHRRAGLSEDPQDTGF